MLSVGVVYSGKPHILQLPEVKALIVDLGLVRCAAFLSQQKKGLHCVCNRWPIVKSLHLPRLCCSIKERNRYVYSSAHLYAQLSFDWD